MSSLDQNFRQIIVLKVKERWTVRSDRTPESTFPDQRDALKAAVNLAEDLGKNGSPARVMLLDLRKGIGQPFWTYGQDAYPPSI